MGFQSAQIKYDLPAPSQELQLPGRDSTHRELREFLDSAIRWIDVPAGTAGSDVPPGAR
jgi:hypothetical protein